MPSIKVAVLTPHLAGVLHSRPAHVEELADGGRDDAHRGDVEQGVEARVGALHHRAAEVRKRPRARRPAVHRRRHAARDVDGVRLEAVAADTPVGVHVHVDKARRDDQPGRVNHLASLAVDAVFNRRDLAVRNRHVANFIQPERGVDYRSTLYEQVVQFDTLQQSLCATKAALVYHAARPSLTGIRQMSDLQIKRVTSRLAGCTVGCDVRLFETLDSTMDDSKEAGEGGSG